MQNADSALLVCAAGGHRHGQVFRRANKQSWAAAEQSGRLPPKHNHLRTRLEDITSTQRVMEAAGGLASHQCDGPVLLGVTVSGRNFVATMMRGTSFGKGALAEALYAMDESVDLQNDAERGNNMINANAMSSPIVSSQAVDWLFEGATLRLDHANVPLQRATVPELDGLKWLGDNGYLTEARAFLHGQAAMCAFALQGALDVDAVGELGARGKDLRRMHAERPDAASLGRLAARNTPENMADPDNVTLLKRARSHFTQLATWQPTRGLWCHDLLLVSRSFGPRTL